MYFREWCTNPTNGWTAIGISTFKYMLLAGPARQLVIKTCFRRCPSVVDRHLIETDRARPSGAFIQLTKQPKWPFLRGSSVTSLIAMFIGPKSGPSGADRTQVGPMLTQWTLLSGVAHKLCTRFDWVLFGLLWLFWDILTYPCGHFTYLIIDSLALWQ